MPTFISAIHKFGRNTDSDTGDDVWDGSSAYPFPEAAAATTIVSDSGDDDVAGTGALTVQVQGLDANYASISETAIMTGAGAVTLDNEYLRVFRAKVLTAGSGGVNAGNIQIKHGATVLAQITADMGQTLMSIYTLAADQYGWMQAWRASSDGNASAKVALQVREFGGAWATKDLMLLDNVGNSSMEVSYAAVQRYEPKTDFRIHILAGANLMDIVAQFEMYLSAGQQFGQTIGGNMWPPTE